VQPTARTATLPLPALSNAAWTKVQSTFSFSNQPGPPSTLIPYLQSSSPTDSFYVSDVVISELAPPPPDASLPLTGFFSPGQKTGVNFPPHFRCNRI